MLRELKNYLLFLKGYGYTEIPQQIELNLSASKKNQSKSFTNIQQPRSFTGGPGRTGRLHPLQVERRAQ